MSQISLFLLLALCAVSTASSSLTFPVTLSTARPSSTSAARPAWLIEACVDPAVSLSTASKAPKSSKAPAEAPTLRFAERAHTPLGGAQSLHSTGHSNAARFQVVDLTTQQVVPYAGPIVKRLTAHAWLKQQLQVRKSTTSSSSSLPSFGELMMEDDNMFVALGVSRVCAPIDLSEGFVFRAGHQYEVHYTSTTEVFLPHADEAVPAKMATGEALRFVCAFDSTAPMEKDSTAVTAKGVAAKDAFDQLSCSEMQQSDNAQAVAAAMAGLVPAIEYLNSSCLDEQYTEWFGVYAPQRYGEVQETLVNALALFRSNEFRVDCDGSACQDSYYAYVYPGDSTHTVYVCGAYWRASAELTWDSRPGTQIHELSHFNDIGNTDDVVYGRSGARALAGSDPDNAVNNADSTEYFVEQGVDPTNCPIVANYTPPVVETVPSNFSDSCAESAAVVVSGDAVVIIRGDIEGFGASMSGTSMCASSSQSADGWVKINATRSGLLTADITAGNFDTVLSVHIGCNQPSTLCNDDGGSGYLSKVTFPIGPGDGSVYLRVAAYSGRSPDVFTMRLTLAVFEEGPPHSHSNETVFVDQCTMTGESDTAVTMLQMNSSDTLHGHFVGASASRPSEVCHSSEQSLDVFHAFYVTGEAVFLTLEIIPDEQSLFNPVMSVHDGCNGRVLLCDDDSGSGSYSKVSFAAAPDTLYAVRISTSSGAAAGPFSVTYQASDATVQHGQFADVCLLPSAPVATLGEVSEAVLQGQLFGSTTSSLLSDMCGSSSASMDVWASIDVRADGWLSAEVISASSLDTVISIHRPCSSVQACDDDGGAGYLSLATTRVYNDTQVAVRVSVYGGVTSINGLGEFSVRASLSPLTGSDSSEDGSSSTSDAGLAIGLTAAALSLIIIVCWAVNRRKSAPHAARQEGMPMGAQTNRAPTVMPPQVGGMPSSTFAQPAMAAGAGAPRYGPGGGAPPNYGPGGGAPRYGPGGGAPPNYGPGGGAPNYGPGGGAPRYGPGGAAPNYGPGGASPAAAGGPPSYNPAYGVPPPVYHAPPSYASPSSQAGESATQYHGSVPVRTYGASSRAPPANTTSGEGEGSSILPPNRQRSED